MARLLPECAVHRLRPHQGRLTIAITYTIREATWADLEKLARRLHPADKEVLERHGVSAFRTMQTGMECSRPCQVGLADGEPICVFGAIPMPRNEAAVWFMARDDAFEKHAPAILKRSLAWIKMLDYSVLHNVSRSDIPELAFWVRWLGFEPQIESGESGFPMTQYRREAA